jgi:ubiquinol-cytochrome c reductase cytochrome b subunit
VRSNNFRPLYRQFFWILMAVILILGYLGAQTADDSNVVVPWTGVELPIGKLLLSQILTIYYFLHFLIITPVVGLWETPLPVPESISKAVLAKKGVSSAPAAAE